MSDPAADQLVIVRMLQARVSGDTDGFVAAGLPFLEGPNPSERAMVAAIAVAEAMTLLYARARGADPDVVLEALAQQLTNG